MQLNREKGAFLIALAVFLGEAYSLAVGRLSPARDKPLPSVDLPRVEREYARPAYRRYEVAEIPARNPFSPSEGWRPLDAVPLPPPPVPDRIRVLPLLSASAAPEDGGVLFEVKPPKITDGEDPPAAAVGTSGAEAPGGSP
jgi:hypothetical protein